jgi:hypothetical protein
MAKYYPIKKKFDSGSLNVSKNDDSKILIFGSFLWSDLVKKSGFGISPEWFGGGGGRCSVF